MNKRVMCIGTILAVTTLVGGQSMASPIVDWDFAADEGWVGSSDVASAESLELAGWDIMNVDTDPNKPATTANRFAVEFAAQNNWDNVLSLEDHDAATRPSASIAFGAVTQGVMTIHAGTAGNPRQYGQLSLQSNGVDLFRIQLQDNNTANIFFGSSEVQVTHTHNIGFNRVGEYVLNWSVNADGSGGLASLTIEGIPVVTDVALLGSCVPDSLFMRVGVNSFTNRILLVDSLKIEAVPEPATLALVALGAVVVLGRRPHCGMS